MAPAKKALWKSLALRDFLGIMVVLFGTAATAVAAVKGLDELVVGGDLLSRASAAVAVPKETMPGVSLVLEAIALRTIIAGNVDFWI
jgi:hypothetical protein